MIDQDTQAAQATPPKTPATTNTIKQDNQRLQDIFRPAAKEEKSK